jgi:hypothetical protein
MRLLGPLLAYVVEEACEIEHIRGVYLLPSPLIIRESSIGRHAKRFKEFDDS